MVLRKPVDFIHSLHGQLLRSGNENEGHFRRAWLSEENRKRGENIPSMTSDPRILFYSEQAKYCEDVERFLGAFGRSQAKILIYDDLREDNLSVYKEVLEFLEIDSDFKPELMEMNPSKEVRVLKLATWLIYHGEKKKRAVEQWAVSGS